MSEREIVSNIGNVLQDPPEYSRIRYTITQFGGAVKFSCIIQDNDDKSKIVDMLAHGWKELNNEK